MSALTTGDDSFQSGLLGELQGVHVRGIDFRCIYNIWETKFKG